MSRLYNLKFLVHTNLNLFLSELHELWCDYLLEISLFYEIWDARDLWQKEFHTQETISRSAKHINHKGPILNPWSHLQLQRHLIQKLNFPPCGGNLYLALCLQPLSWTPHMCGRGQEHRGQNQHLLGGANLRVPYQCPWWHHSAHFQSCLFSLTLIKVEITEDMKDGHLSEVHW